MFNKCLINVTCIHCMALSNLDNKFFNKIKLNKSCIPYSILLNECIYSLKRNLRRNIQRISELRDAHLCNEGNIGVIFFDTYIQLTTRKISRAYMVFLTNQSTKDSFIRLDYIAQFGCFHSVVR